MVVWKETLELSSVQIVSLPKDSQILKVDSQNGMLCIWFMHEDDPNDDVEYDERTIDVVGTGHVFSADGKKHIGTVIMGAFVWHVFEVIDG